ncbi:glycosyltransferase [bacterium]|nr:glycosyltransferase [bacterium]MBU4510908.1 glycosyltransferase [bacterium]
MLSNQKNPLVSICMPTYNSARFLRESLDSVVNQTYPNKEIIVSDNASTDKTKKL